MKKKHAYLIGIKGVAMTALAVYLKEKGYDVSGSDVSEVFHTDGVLSEHGIPLRVGFTAENVPRDADVVVVTGAHGGMTNAEAREAKRRGIPTYMHGEYLGLLLNTKKGIAVCGCHGKTTTAALTAWILHEAGVDPSYAVGTAEILQLGASGHFGTGDYFVAEADEYMTCPETDKTPRFLWLHPHIAVITTIDYDHPDAFKSINEVKDAYITFANQVKEDGTVIVCMDDPNVRDILPLLKRPVVTYGFHPNADIRIDRVSFTQGKTLMRLTAKTFDEKYTIPLAGNHNVQNAAAAIIAAKSAGISFKIVKRAVQLFGGTKRRFEKIAQVGKVTLYDDYAHHPSEIAATLQAIKDWYPSRRVIVLFQPHTFSRTKALLSDFAKSFRQADIALITDIFASKREAFDPEISSRMIVSEMQKVKDNAVYVSGKTEALEFLKRYVKANDLILTMGAGDIYSWHPDIIETLQLCKHLS